MSLQVKFLTYALGGADEYHGTDPTVSHRRLHNEKGLRVEHFHIVLGHLQDTLRELGVAEVCPRAHSSTMHSYITPQTLRKRLYLAFVPGPTICTSPSSYQTGCLTLPPKHHHSYYSLTRRLPYDVLLTVITSWMLAIALHRLR